MHFLIIMLILVALGWLFGRAMNTFADALRELLSWRLVMICAVGYGLYLALSSEDDSITLLLLACVACGAIYWVVVLAKSHLDTQAAIATKLTKGEE
jgi:hypothetical protein